MRINTVREAILSKYLPQFKSSYDGQKPLIVKKSKTTLEEFYREVFAQDRLVKNFHNQNAQDIETTMVQNRRLIESKRKSK